MNRILTSEQIMDLRKQRRIRYLQIAVENGWILFNRNDNIVKELLDIRLGSRGRADLSTVSNKAMQFAENYWEADKDRRIRLMEMTDETFYKD